MLTVTYDDEVHKKYDINAADVVEDDDEGFKAMLWIIKNKHNKNEWKDQVSERIENKLKHMEESPFFNNWIDWDTFIEAKIKEGMLSEKYLGAKNSKGGEKHFHLVVAQSPLKNKKRQCTFNHDFLEETNKSTAKRGSGYILDGITCEGHKTECGKEFVSDVSEATKPEMAVVVSSKNGAWWCRLCNLVLCVQCHTNYCGAIQGTRTGHRRLNPA
jgi:hypothetical protein